MYRQSARTVPPLTVVILDPTFAVRFDEQIPARNATIQRDKKARPSKVRRITWDAATLPRMRDG